MKLHSLWLGTVVILEIILVCWALSDGNGAAKAAMGRRTSEQDGNKQKSVRKPNSRRRSKVREKKVRQKWRKGGKRGLKTTTEVPNVSNATMSTTLNNKSVSDDNIYTNKSVSDQAEHLYTTCPVCVMRQNRKAARLEAIKADILRKLDMTEPPNVSDFSIPKIPPLDDMVEKNYLNDMIPQQVPEDETDDDYHAQPISIILFRKDPPSDKGLDNDTCYFQIGTDKKTKVSRALLGVYLRPVNSSRQEEFKTAMLVYQRIPSKIKGGAQDKSLVVSRNISLRPGLPGRWIEMELTEMVNQWITEPESNLGLEISAFDSSGNSIVVNQPLTEEENKQQPYLETYPIPEFVTGRARRSPPQMCDASSLVDTCCLFPFTIDFYEEGWMFILSPTRMDANYCYGSCPVAKAYTEGDYTVAVASAVIEMCCSPVKFKPLRLVYRDENGDIAVDSLDNAIAQECGCR